MAEDVHELASAFEASQAEILGLRAQVVELQHRDGRFIQHERRLRKYAMLRMCLTEWRGVASVAALSNTTRDMERQIRQFEESAELAAAMSADASAQQTSTYSTQLQEAEAVTVAAVAEASKLKLAQELKEASDAAARAHLEQELLAQAAALSSQADAAAKAQDALEWVQRLWRERVRQQLSARQHLRRQERVFAAWAAWDRKNALHAVLIVQMLRRKRARFEHNAFDAWLAAHRKRVREAQPQSQPQADELGIDGRSRSSKSIRARLDGRTNDKLDTDPSAIGLLSGTISTIDRVPAEGVPPAA
jgi:hypothetical protein